MLKTTKSEDIASYGKIIDAIAIGIIRPVIGFEQPYEWCPGGNPESGLEIASVLDRASHCYEMADLMAALVVEGLQEIVRLCAIRSVELPDLLHNIRDVDEWHLFMLRYSRAAQELDRRTGLTAVREEHARAGHTIGGRKFSSVHNMVVISANAESWRPDQSVGRREDLRTAFERAKGVKSTRPVEREVIGRALARLDLLVDLARGMGVTDDLESVLEQIELPRCPALSLWAAFWPRYVRGKPSAVRTDAPDVAFLPTYCYADFALTEKQMRHFVCESDPRLRTRVVATASELVGLMGL